MRRSRRGGRNGASQIPAAVVGPPAAFTGAGTLMAFTGAASLTSAVPAFPTIVGNKLRMRADLGITTETGGRIITLVDQSGTTTNWVATTGTTARPTLIANASGTNSCIRYDGVANKLICSGTTLTTIITASAYTVYAVWTNNGTVADDVLGYPNGQVVCESGGYWGQYGSLTKQGGWDYSGAAKVAKISQTPGSLTYTRTKLSAGTLSFKLGLAGTPDTLASGTVDAVTGTLQAGVNYNGTRFLAHDLYELVVYNVATTAQNDTDMENYFSARYGTGI